MKTNKSARVISFKRVVKLLSAASFLVLSCCFINVFAAPEVITELGKKVMTVDAEIGSADIEPIKEKTPAENWLVLTRRLEQVCKRFIPKRISYNGVSYEYDDGTVTAKSSSGKILLDACIKALGISDEYQPQVSSKINHRYEVIKDRKVLVCDEVIIHEEGVRKAIRPFHTLHIIGDFEEIPGSFLIMETKIIQKFGGQYMPVVNIYMNQSKVKNIREGAFNGLSRDTIKNIEFSSKIKKIERDALDICLNNPNLNASAQAIFKRCYKP